MGRYLKIEAGSAKGLFAGLANAVTNRLSACIANRSGHYAGEENALTNNVLAAVLGLTMTDNGGDDLLIYLWLNQGVSTYNVSRSHLNFGPSAQADDQPSLMIDFAIDWWE